MNLFKDGLGRKFIACMYFQTAMFLLLAVEKLPVQSFEFLTLVIFGGYVGGNIGQRIIDKKVG